MNMNPKSLAGLLFAVLLPLLLVAPASVAATDTAPPRLPCGVESYPAAPALNAPPNAMLWTGATLDEGWRPPACTGWQPAPTTLVVALAGHFSNGRDVDAMLARIGKISALREVRYWSVTDKRWDALFTQATGLDGPNPGALRTDFSSAEIHNGSDLFFLSADNRLQKDVVNRLRAKEVGPKRIVLETTNVSPLRWLRFTMVPAGDMQTLYFLERQADGSWQFYSLTRVLNASSLLSRLVTGPSYVNRAVAMYRYIAGIPTDRDPPAMP
jgi:hypothetical protein